MISFGFREHLLAAVQYALDMGKAGMKESLQFYSYIHRIHFSTSLRCFLR